MTWQPKNVNDSLIPLKIAYAIIGHGIFYWPVGRRYPKSSLIYAIIITSLYCVALGFTIDFCLNSPWFGPAERIFAGVVYANTAIAGLAQILSWYHSRTCFRFGEKITMVDETLQELGATFDYNRALKIGIALVVLWLIIILSLNAINVLWLLNVIPVYQTIIVVCVLHHPFHVNSIVAFHFSMAVRHVHLELSSITKDLNRAYGVQIALEITAYLVMFTGNLYNLYTVIMSPSLDRRHSRILILVVWCGTYFVKLVLINQACEDASAEARRTGEIIHRIHESVRDPELTDEIRQFSLQIIQRPLHFSPAGLFTLGFKFVLGFLGTLTTYLVILVDMSGESTRRRKR